MKRTVRETLTARVLESTGTTSGGKVGALFQLISPGIGSGGAYPTETLEAAGRKGVFPADMHVYADHPTRSEERDRPERSVRDLAGAISEAARWDPERQALVAEGWVDQDYGKFVDPDRLGGIIGMSIRAYATIEEGTYEGKKMPVVTEILEGISVDLVTHAGRDGKVLTEAERAEVAAVIESATPRSRELAEATVNDRREQIDAALTDAYAVPDEVWVYVRDFDPEAGLVYFDQYGDEQATYSQSYEVADDDLSVTLTGDRQQVTVRTQYVPVDPAGDDTTQESLEDTMPQIEEARLRQLETDAGRVSVLETERDTARTEAEAATARAETAERALAESTARTAATARARTRVTEANAGLAPVVVDRIVAEATRTVPVTEAGVLDEAALDVTVEAARVAEETYLASLRPTGVTGFASVPVGESADAAAILAELDKQIDNRIGAN